MSGAELLLESVAPGKVRRAALEQALREAVRAGRLVPGARLPSSRALAVEVLAAAVQVHRRDSCSGGSGPPIST